MRSAALLLTFAFMGAPQTTKPVTLATSVSPAAVAPGGNVTLAVDVTPKPKVHVYAPGQDGYIAITATLDKNAVVSAAEKPRYPAAQKIVIPAINETQLVYSKPFRITEEIAIAKTPEAKARASAGGTVTLTGTVRYQACNDVICFPPTTVPVAWTIRLASR